MCLLKRLTVAIILSACGLNSQAFSQDVERLEKRFKSFDKNKDGKLTESEVNRKLLFKRLDLNKDGELTLEEVKSAVNKLRKKTNRSFRVKRNISYGKHKSQKLDLYSPLEKPDRKMPVMIYVHGGGWKIGDKAATKEKPAYFTKKKWAFVSTNYRLHPDGKHPKNVEDIAAAIAWVHDHADEYNIDPDSIFIMGHSAGCHLVALVATDERHLKKHKKSLKTIKGVIALDTQAYDLPKLIARTRSKTYSEVFGTEESELKDASPFHHIVENKNIPPFVVAYSRGMGARVQRGRAEANREFADALKKAGVEAVLVDASDRNHGEINQWFGTAKDKKVTTAAEKLFKSVLKQK